MLSVRALGAVTLRSGGYQCETSPAFEVLTLGTYVEQQAECHGTSTFNPLPTSTDKIVLASVRQSDSVLSIDP
jgi:hypothetical protein